MNIHLSNTKNRTVPYKKNVAFVFFMDTPRTGTSGVSSELDFRNPNKMQIKSASNELVENPFRVPKRVVRSRRTLVVVWVTNRKVDKK